MTGRQGQPAGQGWDSGISSSTTDHGWKTRTTARREKGDPSTAHLPYANRQREEGASREQDAGTARGAYRDHAVVATGAATRPGHRLPASVVRHRGAARYGGWTCIGSRLCARGRTRSGREAPAAGVLPATAMPSATVSGGWQRATICWVGLGTLAARPSSLRVSWARAAGCGRPGWSLSISTEIPGVCVWREIAWVTCANVSGLLAQATAMGGKLGAHGVP